MTHFLVVIWLSASWLCPVAISAPFEDLIIFGDSHSDTGNFVAAYNIGWFPHYARGRASNGPMWVETLAIDLGLPQPTPSAAGGRNYAWGGARTGLGNDTEDGFTWPKVGTQVRSYMRSHQPQQSDLFVLFAGHNDFGWGNERTASVPVANITDHIRELASAGAQNFLVPNLFDIGLVPAYRNSPEESALKSLVGEFNQLLDDALLELQQDLAIRIYRPDFHGLVEQAVTRPSLFGLVNVLEPAIADGVVVSDPSEYLFWDSDHFTADFYQVLGHHAAEVVPEPASLWLVAMGLISVCAGRCRGGARSRQRVLRSVLPRRL